MYQLIHLFISLNKCYFIDDMKDKLLIENIDVTICGEVENPKYLFIINTFKDEIDDIYNQIISLNEKAIYALIEVPSWNEYLSPWYAGAVFKGGEDFKGEGDKYLKLLIDTIIPTIRSQYNLQDTKIIIGGYSLAGLFALYSIYKTDIFDGCISASGSLWFEDFKEYIEKHDLLNENCLIYLSLGDKEANSKNNILKEVQNITEYIYHIYLDSGYRCTFELNEGNHFKDPGLRLIKGIKWILKQ